MKDFYLLIIALTINLASPAGAKDFAIHGHSFEILEPDLLKQIEYKLKALNEDGTLAEHEMRLMQKAKKSILRPQGSKGITKAIEDRIFSYDPSFVIPYDLKDHKGKVFHKAGTRINPLQYKSLSSTLAFIDGDDLNQVAWAEGIQAKQTSKVILTSGAPFQLMEKWRVPVYFDQGGTLTKKLGIKHVPALVIQEGLRLKISEIALKEDVQ